MIGSRMLTFLVDEEVEFLFCVVSAELLEGDNLAHGERMRIKRERNRREARQDEPG